MGSMGHSGVCKNLWNQAATDLCPCGEKQTMSYSVNSCPLTTLNGCLSQLHSDDDEAIAWLTNYGSWCIYARRRMGGNVAVYYLISEFPYTIAVGNHLLATPFNQQEYHLNILGSNKKLSVYLILTNINKNTHSHTGKWNVLTCSISYRWTRLPWRFISSSCRPT